MTQQYLRELSLIVADGAKGKDLSQLHIRFSVRQWDIQTPNTAVIRVFNLSDQTAAEIKEFKRVILQAGYQGNSNTIFDGQVKQFRRGRENATDTYWDIIAADGDEGLNFAVTNTSLAAGATMDDQIKAHAAALGQYGVTRGFTDELPKDKLPRGKVLFGMARDGLRDLMASNGFGYSIQNGKLQIVKLDGFVPGEVVRINSDTGMVGIPEQTENGIKVRMLLNPKLTIGSKLQLNEGDVTQALAPTSGLNVGTFIQGVPGIAPGDGVYRIYVIEHEGDTRGNDWYSDTVCLSIDPTQNNALTPGLVQRGAG